MSNKTFVDYDVEILQKLKPSTSIPRVCEATCSVAHPTKLLSFNMKVLWTLADVLLFLGIADCQHSADSTFVRSTNLCTKTTNIYSCTCRLTVRNTRASRDVQMMMQTFELFPRSSLFSDGAATSSELACCGCCDSGSLNLTFLLPR